MPLEHGRRESLRLTPEQARALYIAAVQKRNAIRERGKYEGTDAEVLDLVIPPLADIGWPTEVVLR